VNSRKPVEVTGEALRLGAGTRAFPGAVHASLQQDRTFSAGTREATSAQWSERNNGAFHEGRSQEDACAETFRLKLLVQRTSEMRTL